MILGLGSDLIDIRRIAETIERYGDRFIGRIFTPLEQAKSDKRAERAASYAKRFAAKEACGKPTMQLTGGALQRLNAMLPPGHSARIELSITDDFPLAQAIVIIWAASEAGLK
jgi:holo-[acyl-carrier protein] synthase